MDEPWGVDFETWWSLCRSREEGLICREDCELAWDAAIACAIRALPAGHQNLPIDNDFTRGCNEGRNNALATAAAAIFKLRTKGPKEDG